MKKIIISLLLIASLLLTFISCDVTDVIEEETTDNPELNAEAVVDAINVDKTLGEVFSSSTAGAADIDFAKVLEEFKTLELEGNVSVMVDGQAADFYAGLKDSTAFFDMNGGYIFIEDDLKLVIVSLIEGEYVAEVDDGFSEFLPLLGGSEGETDIPSVGGSGEDMMSAFADIKLPTISKDDIVIDGDKYILGDGYVAKVTELIVDAYCNNGALEGGTQAEKDAMKAELCEYVEAMNIALWFYVEEEEIVGMGMDIAPAQDVAEELLGVEKLAFTFDMKKRNITIDCEAVVDGETYKFDFGVLIVTDANGENINSVDITADVTMPYSEEAYGDDGSISEIRSTVNASARLVVDFAKMANGGKALSLKVNCTSSDYKVYDFNYGSYEYVYNAEKTDARANDRGSIQFELGVENVSENEMLIDAIGTVKDVVNGEETVSEYSVSANLFNSANNFPEIPEEVERARQEALDGYGDFEFDFN